MSSGQYTYDTTGNVSPLSPAGEHSLNPYLVVFLRAHRAPGLSDPIHVDYVLRWV